MSDSIQKHHNGYHQNRDGNNQLQTYSLPNSQPKDNNALDPRYLVKLILRYKWIILLLVILGGMGAWFYSDTITPIYESQGTIMITAGASGDDELSQIISQTTGMGTNSTLANELQVLQSRAFSRQVAQRVMDKNPGYIDEYPVIWSADEDGNVTRSNLSTVASRIRSNSSVVRPERDADIIKLSFSSSSPVEAAFIVNEAMDVYVDESTMQNRQAAESTAEFLEEEKERIKQRLDESERKLKEFMDRTGIVQVDQQASGLVTQQSNVETEIQQIELDLETINRAIEQHEEQMERIRPGLSEQFSEALGPRIRNSQEQLAQYEGERTMILTRNPGVRDREQTPQRLKYLDEQIERIKNEIQNMSDKLFTEDNEYLGMDSEERAQMVATTQARITELRIEKNQLESRAEALRQRSGEVEQEFNNLPEGMMQLAQLQRNVRINEGMFVNVSGQYADMSVLKQSQFGFGRILDTGLVPNSPVSPNKKILLLIGLMLGGVLSAGFIAIREFFDNSISSMDELKLTSLPMLAAVPVLDKVSKRNQKSFKNSTGKIPDELVLLRDRTHVASESIRRLKNNIIYQHGDIPPKTIAITSPEKGDGKSTVVSNLGVAFAEEGYKTLVIDTDFRRPKLHNYYGLPNENGLTDYLEGKLPVQKILKDTDLGYLKMISSGTQTDRPESIVSSKEFKQFLKKMEDVFDVIILDTPPFGIISDSTTLLKDASVTLLVTKYRKTNRGVFLKTVEELERINANVSGIVLNGFDHRKEAGGDYGAGYYKSVYTDYESYVK
jgi:capsular exopolysaccharide synthesis family protein